VCIAWKSRPRNDLYCFGWVIKPYSLTHSLLLWPFYWVHNVMHSGCDVLSESVYASELKETIIPCVVHPSGCVAVSQTIVDGIGTFLFWGK